MNRHISRRDFLQESLVYSALGLAPQFLTRTAEAATRNIHGFADDRVLVVVQLGGGNDGLNTLVPYGDDAYHRLRPTLAVPEARTLRIDDYIGFNDQFKEMMRLYDAGNLAIVQGVGYPNPDRSHFRSMEIWHTASDSDHFAGEGWIGRYFDHACTGSAKPEAGVAVSAERPQAFDGDLGLGVAFEDPRNFGWRGNDSEERKFAQLNESDRLDACENLDFLRHVTSSTIMSSEEVQRAADHAGGGANIPGNLGNPLSTVASLIRGGLDTRIFYVSISGFDTHANQPSRHDGLLRQVGAALRGFQDTLKRDGTDDRVMTMVFSEFGRRVAENKSRGTDHGTAAPMFLLGKHVNAGLHGTYPSLNALDDGDLVHTVDFRQVYASVLQDWFKVDAAPVLGRGFDTLPLIG